VIGIGPAKTASSTTFQFLSKQAQGCFWREANYASFHETHDLRGKHVTVENSKRILFSHFAPAVCCKASVMKSPSWAASYAIPFVMKTMFDLNSKITLVLTIREPASAMQSLYNMKCSAYQLPWDYRGFCANSHDFYKQVIADTDKTLECTTRVKAENTELEGLDLALKLEKCDTYLSLASYDYVSTHRRWAEQFGSENIYCLFMSDLKTDTHDQNFRNLAKFVGMDLNPGIGETGHKGRMYRFRFTAQQLSDLQSKYASSFGQYNEGDLRRMCAHSSSQSY